MTKIKEVDIIKTCWTGSGNLVSHCFHTLPVILHSLHCRLVAIAREDTTRCFPSRTVPKVSFCHSGTSLFSVERKKKGTNYRETFHPFCILSHFILFFYFPFFLMSYVYSCLLFDPVISQRQKRQEKIIKCLLPPLLWKHCLQERKGKMYLQRNLSVEYFSCMESFFYLRQQKYLPIKVTAVQPKVMEPHIKRF